MPKPDRSQKKIEGEIRWPLKREAEGYRDSQQSGRPRCGVWWYAVDSVGHLALLSSMESGLVPLDVFTNTLQEHLFLVEHFLRPSTESMAADIVVDAPKLGLYYYDIVEFGTLDGYDRLGIHERPLLIEECVPEIRKLIEKVRYPGEFRATKCMQVKKHWPAI